MSTDNKPHQPTLADVFALVQKCASKDDIHDIKSHLTAYKLETDEKFDKIKQHVDSVTITSNSNSDKIDELQASIETLKQEQLKNKICISGVPVDITTNNNTAGIIMAIADKLDVKLAKNNFTSYAVSEKIATASSYGGRIRARKHINDAPHIITSER